MSADLIEAAKREIAYQLLECVPVQSGRMAYSQLHERVLEKGHAAEHFSAAYAELDDEGRIWRDVKKYGTTTIFFSGDVFPTSALRQWANARGIGAVGRVNQLEAPPEIDRCIVSLGDRAYQIGSHSPQLVSEREENVLVAFLDTKRPLDLNQLSKATGLDPEMAGRVIRRLCEKYQGMFQPAIRRPGKKGQGGYWIAVATLSETLR
jgi:hypothetical protein